MLFPRVGHPLRYGNYVPGDTPPGDAVLGLPGQSAVMTVLQTQLAAYANGRP